MANPAYKGEGQWGRTVEYRTRKRTDGRPTMPMDYPQIVDSALQFLLDPAREHAPAAQMLQEADEEAHAAAAQAATIAACLAEIEREQQWLIEEGMRGRYPRERLDAAMDKLQAYEAAQRTALQQAQARGAVAAAGVPAAEEIGRVCRLVVKGAAHATAEQKRAVLDLLSVEVWTTGRTYEIRGVVPKLRVRGTLAAREQANGQELVPVGAPTGGS